ncbi:MAG: hypothetical protein ACRENP_26315 [Longimicrobiales bacterium]
MSLFDAMRYRLRTVFRSSAAEREREEEFAFHHSLAEQELLQGAVDADEARHSVRRTFGNATYLKEEIRQMGALRWIDALRQDLRFGARLLWKEKTFRGCKTITDSFIGAAKVESSNSSRRGSDGASGRFATFAGR